MNAHDLHTILHAEEIEELINPTAIIRDWFLDSANASTTKLPKLHGLDATSHKNRSITTGRLKERCTRRILQTDSGSFYKLHGPCSAERMTEKGWSSGFIKVFATGFPTNWKSFLEDELIRMKVRRKLDGIKENGAVTLSSRIRTPVKEREERETTDNNTDNPAVQGLNPAEQANRSAVGPIDVRPGKKRTRASSPVEKEASPVRIAKRLATGKELGDMVDKRNGARNAVIQSDLPKAGPSQSKNEKEKSSVIATRPSRQTRSSKNSATAPAAEPARPAKSLPVEKVASPVRIAKRRGTGKEADDVVVERNAAKKAGKRSDLPQAVRSEPKNVKKKSSVIASRPSRQTRNSKKAAVPAAQPFRQTRSVKNVPTAEPSGSSPVEREASPVRITRRRATGKKVKELDDERNGAKNAAKRPDFPKAGLSQSTNARKKSPVIPTQPSRQTRNSNKDAVKPAEKPFKQTKPAKKDTAPPAVLPSKQRGRPKKVVAAPPVKPSGRTRNSDKDAADPALKPSKQTKPAKNGTAPPAVQPSKHTGSAKEVTVAPHAKPSRRTRSAKKVAAAPAVKTSRRTRSAKKVAAAPAAKPLSPLKSPKKRTLKWYQNAVDNISHIPSARKRAAAVLFSPVPQELGAALPKADWTSAEMEEDFTPVTFSDTTRTFRMSAGRKSGRKSLKHVPSNAATAADRQNFRGFLEQEKEQRKKRPRKSPELNQQSSLWSRQESGRKKVGKNLQIPALPGETK